MAFFGTYQLGKQHLTQLEPGHVIAVAPQDDVGTTARHVGGNGDRAGAASLGHDLSFPLHIFRLGIEQVVGNVLLSQKGREEFGFLHAGGTHQHRPTLFVDRSCFIGNGLPLSRFGFVDLIGPIVAGAHPVGGNDGDLELVGLLEFNLLGFRCAGHTRQARIEKKKVLVGNRRQGLGFGLDRQTFLGLNSLVLPVTPAATWHDPP